MHKQIYHISALSLLKLAPMMQGICLALLVNYIEV